MNIRVAEIRDLSKIEKLFHKLLEYLVSCGQTLYAQDRNKLENGVSGFILHKMFDEENSLVLVCENKRGEICGFLIGGIIFYPKFFEHDKLGEIQWHYPLSLLELPTYSRKVARIFEVWAKKKGATAGSNYCLPGNEVAQRLMEYDGRKRAFYYYVKPYVCQEVDNAKLDG